MTELFQTVLNMSITGAYIAAALILLRLAMKRLPRRYSYALWLILGIRLLCPFSFSSAASLFNLVKPEAAEYTANSAFAPVPINGIADAAEQTLQNSQAEQAEQAAQASAVPTSEPLGELTVLAAVWLAGAAAMLLYTVTAYVLVRKRVAGARHLQENIYVCGTVPSPFVYGLARPKIYLPDSIPADETEFILAHERVHIKRGDHIFKLLAMLALCLHWFNPLVWISYGLMVRDMEISCDERAVEGFDVDVRRDYARTLLNISMRQNKLSAGGILAFGESGIKARIKRVLTAKKTGVIASAAAVVIAAAAAVCLLTNAKPEEEQHEDITTADTISETSAAETVSAVSSTVTESTQISTEAAETTAATEEYEGIPAELDEGIPPICTEYLTDHWNYLFKTGEFEPEKYITDPDMLDYAYSEKYSRIATVSHDVASVEIISLGAQGGSTDERRLWVAFGYDLALHLLDGTVDREHYTGYSAYFELDDGEDGLKIYRGFYQMRPQHFGTDHYPLPYIDLKAEVNEFLDMEQYTDDAQVWSPSGGELDRTPAKISYSLPHRWGDRDKIMGKVPGIMKSMEFSPPYPADEKLPREYFTVDEGYGDEITVIAEEHYDDPILSYTDFYHTNRYSTEMQRDIEQYVYVLTRGDYSINVYFYVDDTFIDRWICEKIVSTITVDSV